MLLRPIRVIISCERCRNGFVLLHTYSTENKCILRETQKGYRKKVKMVVEGVWIAMLQVALLVAGVDLGGVLLSVVFSVCRVVCLTQL